MDKMFIRKTEFFFIYLSTSVIIFKKYIDVE